jgi:hypothetical protein
MRWPREERTLAQPVQRTTAHGRRGNGALLCPRQLRAGRVRQLRAGRPFLSPRAERTRSCAGTAFVARPERSTEGGNPGSVV